MITDGRGSRFLAAVHSDLRVPHEEIALVWYRAAADTPVCVTWRELLERSAEMRKHLAGLIAPRTMVPIFGYSSPQLISALLAILELGAVPAIFPAASPRQDPAYFAKQQALALAALNPAAVISIDYSFGEAADDFPAYIEFQDNRIVRMLEGTNAPAATLPDDVLFVQHSSGTTGVKKGIPFAERCLIEQLERYVRVLEFSAFECIGTWLPFYHDMGFVSNLLLALYRRIRLVFTDPFVWADNPPVFFKMIEEQKISHVWMPNFAFRHLTRFFPSGCQFDLSSVRAWVNCSEPCKYDVMQNFCDKFERQGVSLKKLKCCYAMAETIFAVSQTHHNKSVSALRLTSVALQIGDEVKILPLDGFSGTEIVSNGPPLPGVEIRIARDSEFLPPGYIGEIWVRAPFLFEGYLRQENSDVFIEGFYQTGDVGFMHEGEVYILGRIKDLIIVNGRNFLAHEIEACVNGLPGIRQGRSVALGIYSDRLGSEELVIVTEADPARPPTLENDIRKVIYDVFGLTVRDVQLVEDRWIVKSSSGKISREENRLKYLANYHPNQERTAAYRRTSE